MSHNVIRRPQSVRDVEEIFVYIALDNLDAGNRFLLATEECYKRLAEFPFVGTERRFANERWDNLRKWQIPKFEKYLIYYTVSEDTVEIVRVFHSSRDIEELLD